MVDFKSDPGWIYETEDVSRIQKELHLQFLGVIKHVISEGISGGTKGVKRESAYRQIHPYIVYYNQNRVSGQKIGPQTEVFDPKDAMKHALELVQKGSWGYICVFRVWLWDHFEEEAKAFYKEHSIPQFRLDSTTALVKALRAIEPKSLSSPAFFSQQESISPDNIEEGFKRDFAKILRRQYNYARSDVTSDSFAFELDAFVRQGRQVPFYERARWSNQSLQARNVADVRLITYALSQNTDGIEEQLYSFILDFLRNQWGGDVRFLCQADMNGRGVLNWLEERRTITPQLKLMRHHILSPTNSTPSIIFQRKEEISGDEYIIASKSLRNARYALFRGEDSRESSVYWAESAERSIFMQAAEVFYLELNMGLISDKHARKRMTEFEAVLTDNPEFYSEYICVPLYFYSLRKNREAAIGVCQQAVRTLWNGSTVDKAVAEVLKINILALEENAVVPPFVDRIAMLQGNDFERYITSHCIYLVPEAIDLLRHRRYMLADPLLRLQLERY